MAFGLSYVVTRDMRPLFVEPGADGNNSHGPVLTRAKARKLLIENVDHIVGRHWVAIEMPKWTIQSFQWDDNVNPPSWAVNNKDEILTISLKLLERLKKIADPYLAAYKKIKTIRDAELNADYSAENIIQANFNQEFGELRYAVVQKCSYIDGYLYPTDEELELIISGDYVY